MIKSILWTHYLLIATGGALGALSRFFVGSVIQHRFGSFFPWGTFLVNVSGCFLIGFLTFIFSGKNLSSASGLHYFFIVGFLGAYTTFSTFEMEAHNLFADDRWWLAAIYILASIAVGMAALRGGILLAKYTL